MKSLKLQLLLLVCMAANLCSAAWATTLNYDQPTPGKILSPTQSNSYSLSVNAKDVLNFTVVTTLSTSGTLGPCIHLYDPSNNLVDSAGGNYSTVVEMNGYKASVSGSFTVTIKDCADTATGNYVLFVQKTNAPVGAVPLPMAQVTSGKVGSAAQSNAYTFVANVNDVVNFTVVTTTLTSGTLGPCILLYNSTGTPVLDSAGGNYSTTVEMNGYKIPASGTYNVLIKDCADSATGTYDIFLQKSNNPVHSVPIVYDEVQTGTISAPTQSNAYTLIGTFNDVLNFTVTTTSSKIGTLGPCILVYNSAGTPPLASAGGNYATVVELNGFRIPASGIYNVIIKDCADTATGNYTLSTECLGVCELPVPAITSISPASALMGSAGFTLTVNGTGFANVLAKSVVQWNGVDLATTFVNTGQLRATVPPTDLQTAGTDEITVFTPPPGGGTSPPVPFHVIPLLPVFSPVGGTYTSAQSVKITDAAPNATIYYAINATPTISAADEYKVPILVSSSETINAIAVVTQPAGTVISAVASTAYIITGAATPVLTPPGGTYSGPLVVTVTDTTPGATIYCTTDGSDPTTSPTRFVAKTIQVTVSDTTIKCVAVAPGYANSLVASARYLFLAATPVPTPPGGTYTSVQMVRLTDATPGAVIHYTTDGTAPTTSSPIYSTPIMVSANETIEAFAVAPNYANSPPVKLIYVIIGSPTTLSAPATPIGTTGAKLNALVDTQGLAGSYVFEYGTDGASCTLTSTTGRTALAASTARVTASTPITGLTTKTRYCFRAVVTTTGGISYDSILSFTTN